MKLRIVSYNTQSGFANGRVIHDFVPQAEVISSFAPDVVALQEVAIRHPQGKPVDYPAEVAARLKMNYLFAEAMTLGENGHYGVAILSRFPFEFTDSGYVSDETSPYSIHSRRVVMARVRLPFGPPLDVFSAHLSWPENGFDGQYDRLLAWMRARHSPDLAGTLLCGDFNTPPSSPSPPPSPLEPRGHRPRPLHPEWYCIFPRFRHSLPP